MSALEVQERIAQRFDEIARDEEKSPTEQTLSQIILGHFGGSQPGQEVALLKQLINEAFQTLNMGLTFRTLREANIARLPHFKDKHGRIVHALPNGADWTPSGWLQAVIGELGEYANFRKKFERGDITHEDFAVHAAKELADVQTYLDILALRCLDRVEEAGLMDDGYVVRHLAHPTGINLGEATRAKFNEVSERVGHEGRL